VAPEARDQNPGAGKGLPGLLPDGVLHALLALQALEEGHHHPVRRLAVPDQRQPSHDLMAPSQQEGPHLGVGPEEGPAEAEHPDDALLGGPVLGVVTVDAPGQSEERPAVPAVGHRSQHRWFHALPPPGTDVLPGQQG
jgi:hypothetical protein